MKKKLYEAPALTLYKVDPVQVIAESFVVGGDANVGADGEAEEVKEDIVWNF